MSFNHNKSITIYLKLLKVILCLVLTYLSMLAQPLMADYCILPELQLFINEESWTNAAKVYHKAGELFLWRRKEQG